MKNPSSKLWLVLAAAAGVGVWLWWRSRSEAQAAAAGPNVALSVGPIQVEADKTIVADSYRIISGRRSGMSYVPVIGSQGGIIQITAPAAGMFTGNLVQETSGLVAEIKG